MLNVSPVFRLTIGLILLTVSLLLVGDLLGLTPDPKRAELSARKAIAEALAVQVSRDLAEGEFDKVNDTVNVLQDRNDNVVSVGLRAADGRLIAMAGDHLEHWVHPGDGKSTSANVQVPIHGETGRWGVVEVSFQSLDGMSFFFNGSSIVTIILFVAVSGFAAYWIFLKRALNELDPSAVVPGRVRAALDVLAEGLVILDKTGNIVLANTAFEKKFGQMADKLVGNDLAALGWHLPDGKEAARTDDLPWKPILDGGKVPTMKQLKLRTALKELISFAVNAAPIQSADGSVRGAVVTFDDVTELERKNTDLEGALGRLKQSQREISRQNRELQVLATRDALTGSLNRRSLFDGLATLLNEVAADGEPISCIMADIDHFKSINDRFGHATGDKVIKLVAGILSDTARADDLVGRYGGEEFCVVLPGASEEAASEVAERMRSAIHDGKSARFTSSLRISASFGVSTDISAKLTPGALVDLADKALYVAKESGRNRVVRWSQASQISGEDKPEQEQQAATVYSDRQMTPAESTEDREEIVDSAEQQRLRDRIVELELMVRDVASSSANGTDEATGLPNRVVLMDRISQGLERCNRFNMRLAILFVDIDTLQVIRSTKGNLAAEKFLKEAATRIRKTLRSTDTVTIEQDRNIGVSVSRVGGGEFVVLLTDMMEEESTTWIIKRMMAAMSEPMRLDGDEVVPDMRVGVSLYPSDANDPDMLLTNAGAALREAKAAAGRNVCLYFSKEMNERSNEQLTLEAHLHRAVEHNELFLEYQPQVDMRTGRISGFEALLRWRHPELGLVRPDRFIPMAEHAGLMDDIGDWVLLAASRQLRVWQDAGYEDLVMAINFSAVQLRRADLPKRVIAVVNDAGIKPGTLTAEITESALVQNIEMAAEIVEGLSKAGLKVALDDFGTGYSSLSYLKRFPIDVVKIDRSFIRDFPKHTHDTAIVSAVIAMAHSLNLHVVAEGVENDRQLQVLQNLQCDEIQGYLFSKPVSREQAAALLAAPADIRRMVRAATQSGLAGGQDVDSVIAGILNEAPLRRVSG